MITLYRASVRATSHVRQIPLGVGGGSVRRVPQFKNRHGEPAHSEPDGSDWTPAQWLQAVTGKLGEYANLRKKFERGDIGVETFRTEAADELADIITYLDILAMQPGIALGKATLDKFNRVSERVDSSMRLKRDGSEWGHIGCELAADAQRPRTANCSISIPGDLLLDLADNTQELINQFAWMRETTGQNKATLKRLERDYEVACQYLK